VPEGPQDVFDVISPDASNRFVIARGADEDAAKRAVGPYRDSFAGAADRVRRVGVYVIASQDARPPEPLVTCLRG
jgi:hypothetical protein